MKLDRIVLPPSADFHVHVRDGSLMTLVVPYIRYGGVDTVYVMPNLVPPITTVQQALDYKQNLEDIIGDVNFLMTLYLHPSITPDTIAEAAKAGIMGVKCYPAGVTTNSDSGVVDLDQFYPVFKAMEEHNLVLNLHGEVPSTPTASFAGTTETDQITILNAEAKFLPTLHKLHAAFPKLRIVLEHCTTKEALEAVEKCGPTVAATITAHHLWITIDDACGDPNSFCKPVAKTPIDRFALLEAVIGRRAPGKFFFGSDSAPHPIDKKFGAEKVAAGCFTGKYATQLVVEALREAVRLGWITEDDVTLEQLEGFLSRYGKKFYQVQHLPLLGGGIFLEAKGEKIHDVIESMYEVDDPVTKVIPFRASTEIPSLQWYA